jgi:ElaB/YqjD/DUF883 family membrane-anchored ribosome-binding protein
MARAPDELGIYLEAPPADEPKPEEIREQMAETRAALADKLETLHQRMEETVEAAQASVEQTVDAVKRTFDVKYQVRRRPWVMVGASICAGYTLGVVERSLVRRRAAASLGTNGAAAAHPLAVATMSPITRPREIEVMQAAPGHSVLRQFEEEICKLRGVVIGAAMGLARDWLKETAPGVSHQIEEVMDGATRKLGGEPIEGPILNGAFAGRRDPHD